MTKEEFKQYSKLQKKFANDVKRVVGYLKEISKDYDYVDMFYLRDDGMIETYGSHFSCRWQSTDEFNGSFDADMLTWTDEQLHEYVDEKIKEREITAIAKAELTKKQKEERERQEYERLKEKFEK